MIIPHELLLLVALLLIGGGIFVLMSQHKKRTDQSRRIDELLDGDKKRQDVEWSAQPHGWQYRLLDKSTSWLDTKWGRQLVAQEDRALLVQCGYQTSQSKTYFLLTRVGLSIIFPLLVIFLFPFLEKTSHELIAIFFALTFGFLAPKWFLRRQAAKRSKQASRELLVFVDILGLLQGAGLGIDQSLHLIARDFRDVMPVLSGELDVVNRLHASGRTRGQALLRMSEMFRSDSLADLSALIVQIDKHGGAVQEPLRQFGERLREQRRMRMKEEIGKITVKMTGVMVLTLLPSLLIITAGPGFLSVLRALGGMK